jgi:aspartyl-tRNA(Asn)/glutamyl-tRNA(Gln) amidotransferase subunit A
MTEPTIDLLHRRVVSSEEWTTFCLDRIEAVDKTLGAMVAVDAAGALEAARASDRRRSSGQSLGYWDGVPIAVKDNLCTLRLPTTCGSRMLSNYRSPYEATAVAKLRAAGVVLLGKTNLDEFAMGGSTETSCHGPTRNPWDLERTAGGSSGGSAAAVAAGLVPVALGSDTGGSIRQPASYCGLVGLKPSYGRVSRYGLVAFASSLDQVGPISNQVEQSARLLEVISGHDPRDATSDPESRFELGDALERPDRAVRVGVLRETISSQGVDSRVRDAVERAVDFFRGEGVVVEEIDLPHARYAIPVYYLIATSEACSNLARYDGAHFGFRSDAASGDLESMYCRSRSEGFGREVQRRILLGTYALSTGYADAYYRKALQVRQLLADDYRKAFEKVDLLLGPTAPTSAFRLGEKVENPVEMYLQDLFTVGANLAGIPALSIPMEPSDGGLPIGVQLQSRRWAERELLRAGHWLEQGEGAVWRLPQWIQAGRS